MEMDLEEMKRRLAQVEVRQAETQQAEVAGGDTLQRQVAELMAGQDNIRVEFQSVNGRMDDLGQDNRALNDELQLIKDDLGLQMNSLTNRLDDLERRIAELPATVQTSQQATAQAAEPAMTAEEQYQQALDLIRNKNRFADGRKMLETFTGSYPQHDLYVNALYWIGESLYGEKKYELAILQFQEVISEYPKHPKAPAAMLKQALAFNALGDAANARTTMQKLVEEYPDSSQVEAAKRYLEKG
jgi:tol-pal system protein YbgF